MTREEYEYKMNRFIGTLTKTSLEEMFKVINAYQSLLEQEISALTMKVKAQDIIIRDKTAFIEAMSLQLKKISHGRISNNSND